VDTYSQNWRVFLEVAWKKYVSKLRIKQIGKKPSIASACIYFANFLIINLVQKRQVSIFLMGVIFNVRLDNTITFAVY